MAGADSVSATISHQIIVLNTLFLHWIPRVPKRVPKRGAAQMVQQTIDLIALPRRNHGSIPVGRASEMNGLNALLPASPVMLGSNWEISGSACFRTIAHPQRAACLL
jgi:hypothetical protein